jgi:hypothetical protein
MREEDAIHLAIVSYLDFALPKDALFWHTPNTFPSAKIQYHAKLKKMGRRAGIPDLLVLAGSNLIGLEVKAPKGRQSKDQKAIQEQFEAAGGHYHLVRSIDDVRAVLAGHGVIPAAA